MNEHYRDFDEMSAADLVRWLISVEKREPDIAQEGLANLQECAWTCYAGHLGLEYFRGTLMQFGDGGYPYLYTSPADGGDDLCHVCATKEFKKGASVAWSHHMEGEVEHCADCGAEIKPFAFEFTRKPHLLRPYEVGVDPAGGPDFQGLTLVMDGQVIGSVTSVSFTPPRVAGVARLASGMEVPAGVGGELQLSATKVNWPLLARTFEEQRGGDLSDSERAWLEKMKALPNEFDDDEDELPTVACKFCEKRVPAATAHLHQGSWVGDECCWDERLKMTE